MPALKNGQIVTAGNTRSDDLQVTKLREILGHRGSIYALALGNDGQVLCSAGSDRILASWELASGQPAPFSVFLSHAAYAICQVNSPPMLVIGLSNGEIHAVDLEKRTEIAHLSYHSKAIYAVHFNSARGHLYAASGDGSMTVWKAADFSRERTLFLSGEKIRTLAVSPDGQRLAVGSGDGLIRIFETEYFNELCAIRAHQMGTMSLAYHPAHPWLVSGGKDAHLKVWTEDLTCMHSIAAHNYAIYALAFNETGTLLASASRDKHVKIWDGMDFSILRRLDHRSFGAHTHSVNTLVWNIARDELITAGDDKRIIAWKVKLP